MLKRIYIDNYKCFEDFTFEPQALQLVLGANGAGKSMLLEVLSVLRIVSVGGDLEGLFRDFTRTRWASKTKQTFELEVTLAAGYFNYRLVIDSLGNSPKAGVAHERLTCNGSVLLEFREGTVHLFDDHDQPVATYPFDWQRSAVASINPRPDTQKISEFRFWLEHLYCVRIDPHQMSTLTDEEARHPVGDLSNYAAWFRHLVQEDTEVGASLNARLSTVLSGFRSLGIREFGQSAGLLRASFGSSKDDPSRSQEFFYFNELSDGQRTLAALYTLLDVAIQEDRTIIIDEPDNFVTLREIQPWLNEVIDRTEDTGAQVLIISHHPELIDLLAKEHGVLFVREGLAPPRVVPYRSTTDGALAPSEEIARGWERG